MKPKITKGGSFLAGLAYDLSKGDKAQVLVGAGITAKDLAKDLEASKALRPDVEKPVWRVSLNAAHEDGRLSDKKWRDVTESFMKKMGLEDRPFTLIRHSDRDHDHCHLTVSRIGMDGSLWAGKWDVPKAIQACQEIEVGFGLTRTKGLDPEDLERKALKHAEIERAVRTGEAPVRATLQELVDYALEASKGGLQAFCECLGGVSVGLRANIASTGKMHGFSFEYQGVAMKGSDLGKAYTWQGLQRRGLRYEQDRDRETLERYRSVPTPGDRGRDQGLPGRDAGLARGPGDENRAVARPMGGDEAVDRSLVAEAGRNEGRSQGYREGVGRDIESRDVGRQGGGQSEASIVAEASGADLGGAPGSALVRAWDELLAKSLAAYRDEKARGQLHHPLEEGQRKREEALRKDREQALKREEPNLER